MLTHNVKEAYWSSFPYVYWDNFFTPEELSAMDMYFNTLPKEQAHIGERTPDALGKIDLAVRDSSISFVDFDQKNEWIFHRLFALTEMINAHFFNFDLIGFNYLQYTVYDTEGSHYTYHVDMQDNRDGGNVPRKLSFSLILSDDSEYQGGELEFLQDSEPTRAEQKRGRVIAFPSYVVHRVAPVTKGIRRSLVFWACGPKFR